jgi:hypothetical protein
LNVYFFAVLRCVFAERFALAHKEPLLPLPLLLLLLLFALPSVRFNFRTFLSLHVPLALPLSRDMAMERGEQCEFLFFLHSKRGKS